MKHCQKCSLEFPVSFRFCGACGGSLSESFYCQGCGDLVESKWAFCTNCGKKVDSHKSNGQPFSADVPDLMKVSEPASLPSSRPTLQTKTAHPSEQEEKNISNHEWYSAPDLFEETGETTVIPSSLQSPKPDSAITPAQVRTQLQSGNGKAAPTLTMLSAYGVPETAAPPVWQGRGKLLAVLLLMVFFGMFGFGGVYWWTHRASAVQTPPSADAEMSAGPAATDASSQTSEATKPVEQMIARDTADQEWNRLREKRINAKPSEANQVIASLKEAERKYLSDYRFPYERAKLSIKGIASHNESFSALASAAERAIDSGKAQEMLDNLMADKEGDFWKPAHGHHQWLALEEALRNKDKTALKSLHH
jgi:hypothetical protein